MANRTRGFSSARVPTGDRTHASALNTPVNAFLAGVGRILEPTRNRLGVREEAPKDQQQESVAQGCQR